MADFNRVPSHPTLVACAARHANHVYHIEDQSGLLDAQVTLTRDLFCTSFFFTGVESVGVDLPLRSVEQVEPKNKVVLQGLTGMGTVTNLGYVLYSPSELELRLDEDPDLFNKPEEVKKLGRDRGVTVAFRGTTTKNKFSDWFTNLWTFRKSSTVCPDSKGFVHSGFEHAFLSVKDQIASAIRHFLFERIKIDVPKQEAVELINSFYIQVVGHSMGGALAALCACWLNKTPSLSPNAPILYTFAAPKVGDKAFFDSHVLNQDGISPEKKERRLQHVRVERTGGASVESLTHFCSLLIKGRLLSVLGDITPFFPLQMQGFTESGEALHLVPIEGGGIWHQHDILGYLQDVIDLSKKLE